MARDDPSSTRLFTHSMLLLFYFCVLANGNRGFETDMTAGLWASVYLLFIFMDTGLIISIFTSFFFSHSHLETFHGVSFFPHYLV